MSILPSVTLTEGSFLYPKSVQKVKGRKDGALFDLKRAPSKNAIIFLVFEVNKNKESGVFEKGHRLFSGIVQVQVAFLLENGVLDLL